METPDGPSYSELIHELFPRLTGGIRWGLERTRALLERAGNPHHQFRSIHVGGTNGKGSVAATLAAMLSAAGRNAGLYTSPHLCTFRERIQINGSAISEAALLRAAAPLWPSFRELEPSFFEATTVLAFRALADAGVDTAVIEVGLGGRLDATNVITPELSIITNIALDHAEYLGNTIESVAREKAGIIKRGVPVVTGEPDAETLTLFAARAAECGAALHHVTVDDVAGITFDLGGTTFCYGDEVYRTPLIGAHQALNAALAIRAAQLLGPPLSSSVIHAGLEAVSWPGRLQVESIGGRRWLFDVAHNVAGVAALADAVGALALERPLVLVIGILGDKDWQAMLPPLYGLADHAVLTRPPSAPRQRAWDPAAVLAAVPFENGVVNDDFAAALQQAAGLAGHGSVLVTGSFHTVGDALITLGRAPHGSDLALPLIAFSG